VLLVVALLVVAGGIVVLVRIASGPSVPPVPLSRCRVVDTPYHLSTEQAANAATITAVAVRRGLPVRAVTIALAAAIQESKLVNLDYGDRDSVGLFQQRPSQGWGPAAKLTDPVYATGKFYDALVQVRGWRTRPLTVVAQAVQLSGFPQAYAQWEATAAAVSDALVGSTPGGLACSYPLSSGSAVTPDRVAAQLGAELPIHRLVPSGPARLRTHVLDVAATTPARAWVIGCWLAAHGEQLRIASVSVPGYTWHRNDSRWHADRQARPGIVQADMAPSGASPTSHR
jgi:hypothetical protein